MLNNCFFIQIFRKSCLDTPYMCVCVYINMLNYNKCIEAYIFLLSSMLCIYLSRKLYFLNNLYVQCLQNIKQKAT
jgi:hypothetical protein